MPDKTPATIEQVASLIDLIGDLQLELEATRDVVEGSRKKTRAAMFLSVVSIALIFLAGAGALANREAVREIRQTRDEARVVTCVQDNISILKSRQAISESIIALAPPGTALTPDQQARVDAYVEKVTELTPFRDCSPEGIEAYYEDLPADPAVG